MGNMIGSLFGTVVVATTVFTINVFFMGVAGVLRLLPTLFPLAGRLVWGILVFSCRLYYLLLTRVAPLIKRHARINPLAELWRMGTTVGLSLTLGLVILFVSGIGFTFWSVLPFVLHGLFVDFVWDEIPGLADLQMGVRM